MTQFVIAAGLLSLLALAFVLPRLLKQKAFIVAAGLLIGLPSIAGLIYWQVGTPQALSGNALSSTESPPTLMEAIEEIEQRLASQPDDVQGWFLLGRARTNLQQFAAAAVAFERATQLQPNDPVIKAELAGALLLSTGRSGVIPTRVSALLEQALTVDPNQQKALWLRGMIAFQQQDFASSLADWERLAALTEPGSNVAESLRAQIEQARQLSATSPAPTAVTSGRAIEVRVEIADALSNQFDATDTLFVFARAQSGPPAPIAVRKLSAQLPLSVTLDDSSAMQSSRRLSDFSEFTVMARISKSGQPIAQSGDIEGLALVSADQQSVTVTINTIRP